MVVGGLKGLKATNNLKGRYACLNMNGKPPPKTLKSGGLTIFMAQNIGGTLIPPLYWWFCIPKYGMYHTVYN